MSLIFGIEKEAVELFIFASRIIIYIRTDILTFVVVIITLWPLFPPVFIGWLLKDEANNNKDGGVSSSEGLNCLN